MRLSQQEWQPRLGESDFHQHLLDSLVTNGYFILENVLPDSLISSLHKEFVELLEEHIAASESNRGQNRYNLTLPVRAPFDHAEVLANPRIMPVLRHALGDDLTVSFFAADTPLSGSDYQAAHSDGRALFAELRAALPAYAYVVNFPLVDFRMDNGPLEIWPYGSHLIHEVTANTGAALSEPRQVLMPAGSLLVRDNRMWHRGTPNRSDQVRPMLAVVYTRSWYNFGPAVVGCDPIEVPRDTYDGWPSELQDLFRLATVAGNANAERREAVARGASVLR